MKESFSYISQKDDTIVAISTPLGTGGLGVVRISGKEAFSIAVLLLDVIIQQDEKMDDNIRPRAEILGY